MMTNEGQTIPVTWYNQDQRTETGICDFCSRHMPTFGLVPFVHFVVAGRGHDRDVVMPGPWALCNKCRTIIGISGGDTEVSLEAVKLRQRQAIVEMCMRNNLGVDLSARMEWFTNDARKVAVVEGIEVVPGATFDERGNSSYDLEKLAEHFGVPLHSKELGQLMHKLTEMFGRGI